MRIGEIVIAGTGNDEKRLFIQSVCQKLEYANEHIIFGRLAINDQLVLHLYGITIQADSQMVAWDLIAKKMLGYIVLFPWQDADSLERLKPIVDHLAARYDTPMVVAAHITTGRQAIPPALWEQGITLTTQGKFMFCDVRKPESARRILLALIDSLIDKIP
ncbi:MAG: hypothetical protein ONB44_22075 [candidate division KSB1 bacterium]|nr:hypothetical protein [candidate division KSB1 bacterium]MDZ7304825.1 hypothetical protein [candidate division KSB1 bacterium]MDZ7313905.1 hypothetical protein [candidate division KSB1 bacterium]